MSEDAGSTLMPEHGDLEEACEAEIDVPSWPEPPPRWYRWAAVGTLLVVGIAAFTFALVTSAGIPPEGDAAEEARVTALVTMGATAAAAAVTLGAVVLTLGLQREQEQRKRWADFQLQMLREAYEWADGVYARFSAVLTAIQEWAYAVEPERDEKLYNATKMAERFYDGGQQLKEVERLERLIASRDVRAAIRQADRALRGWNEVVAGDHTTRTVRIIDSEDTEWETFAALGEARDQIRDAYAEAIRTAVIGE